MGELLRLVCFDCVCFGLIFSEGKNESVCAEKCLSYLSTPTEVNQCNLYRYGLSNEMLDCSGGFGGGSFSLFLFSTSSHVSSFTA